VSTGHPLGFLHLDSATGMQWGWVGKKGRGGEGLAVNKISQLCWNLVGEWKLKLIGPT